MRPHWFPDWSGQYCVIVAAGPSARDAGIDIARGRARVLVINESWRLAPWADALYAADEKWWTLNEGMPDFVGLRITQDAKAAAKYPGLMPVRLEPEHTILTAEPGVIGSGGNSGFQALNLAVQFGARRVLLVGFDMNVTNGLHWHGKHPAGLNNPVASQIVQWCRRLDAVAPELSRMGVEVVNCAPASVLTAYRKLSFEDALAC